MVSAVAKKWAGKDVVFVGVDEQDLSGPATKFMKRFDITYPVIADDGPLIGHYGVTGYPETFFIDRTRRVIPLPPNKTDQVGHIIGPATAELLDLGIRTAMNARPRTAREAVRRRPSRSWRSSSASRSSFRGHPSKHPTQAPGGVRARLHHVPRAARRVELAACAADEGVHPRASSPPAGRRSRSTTTSSPSSARRCSRCPRRSGFDLLAWLLPFAAIVFGAGGGRRRRARLAAEPRRGSPEDDAPSEPALSAEPRAPGRPGARALRRLSEMIDKIPVAFLAGLISVITPCVLPLVPGYLSAVSAVEVERLGERGAGRRVVIASIPFIAGFTAVFVAARRRCGRGREHGRQDDADDDRRLHPGRARARLRRPAAVAGAGGRPRGCRPRAPKRIRASLLGGAFAVVAAPCIGTVLASILVLASSSGGVARGVVLLLAYSLGLGAAFVLAGIAFAHAMQAFRWVRSHYQALRIVSGVDPDHARAAALLQPRLVAAHRARPAVPEGRASLVVAHKIGLTNGEDLARRGRPLPSRQARGAASASTGC